MIVRQKRQQDEYIGLRVLGAIGRGIAATIGHRRTAGNAAALVDAVVDAVATRKAVHKQAAREHPAQRQEVVALH